MKTRFLSMIKVPSQIYGLYSSLLPRSVAECCRSLRKNYSYLKDSIGFDVEAFQTFAKIEARAIITDAKPPRP